MNKKISDLPIIDVNWNRIDPYNNYGTSAPHIPRATGAPFEGTNLVAQNEGQTGRVTISQLAEALIGNMGVSVIKCKHCGQWGARFCECRKCGAPIE